MERMGTKSTLAIIAVATVGIGVVVEHFRSAAVEQFDRQPLSMREQSFFNGVADLECRDPATGAVYPLGVKDFLGENGFPDYADLTGAIKRDGCVIRPRLAL